MIITKQNSLPILAFILLILACFACENDLAKVNMLINEAEIGKEVAKEVELLYSDSAVIRVCLRGKTMHTYTDDERKELVQEFTEGISVEFFDERQEIQSQLTAKYAIRYDNKKEILVRDSVVWKSAKPETLETEELIWDERKAKVYSKRFVKITTDKDIIYGYGFEADENFSSWKITAPQGEMGVDKMAEF